MNFRKQTGLPPHEYIIRQRVEHAKYMLVNTDMSITGIAYKLLFSSSQYFSTVFKRFTMVTPNQYRKIPRHNSEYTLYS
jgi:AraC-like DNA-binding protein